jgi:2-dehydropantoate 2-reductase
MAKVEEVAEAFRIAGLETEVHENVFNAIWYKLAANVAINGVSALLETPNGFIAKNQYANELAKMLIKEAITVANASGCTLEYEEVLEHAFDVSRKTDETISSMVQDVTHHRETEIRIINGAVSKLGKEHGITKDEAVEIVTQLAFYCGWPKAWSTFPMIQEVYGDE